MTDGHAETAFEYGDLIKEVFIDPIRTVVVVDDQFPTLDSFLIEKTSDKKREKDKARDIVSFCREKSWLVDIYDGQEVVNGTSESFPPHLHHSDLLILDYHLDPNEQSNGEHAINLLRHLVDNEHYNLVVVYTQGDDSRGAEIGKVIEEIVLGLSEYDTRFELHEKEIQNTLELIGDWEDEEPSIMGKLLDTIDAGVLLRVKKSNKGKDIDWSHIYQTTELGELKALIDNGPKSQRWRSIIRWVIHSRQESLKEKLRDKSYGQINYKIDDDEVNWVRTAQLFVTVVSKSHQPSDIPQKLLDAIVDWEPQPHRLLMSKMRSILDVCGVTAEDEVLNNRLLQAGWLQDLTSNEDTQQLRNIGVTLGRHWEGLGDVIRTRLEDYSKRLVVRISTLEKEEMLSKFSPFKAEHKKNLKDIAIEVNSYTCSKPVEGSHLTTGHLLKSEDGKYWLCLSPACDLVPDRQPKGWRTRLESHMPFTAVEMHKCIDADLSKALNDATNGTYLFFNVSGERLVLSFTYMVGEGQNSPNPKVEQLFAQNSGKFDPSVRSVSLVRIKASGDNLEPEVSNMSVVAQLRYEYALNLLQRLGATQTRVGLEFETYSPPTE